MERVKRRGGGDVSAVAAVTLALVAISIIVLNVAFTGKEVSDMEWDAASEHLTVEVAAGSGVLNVTVLNDGSVDASIVAVWVANSSHSVRYSAESLTGARVIALRPGGKFTAKLQPVSENAYNIVIIVTARGNKFSGVVRVP